MKELATFCICLASLIAGTTFTALAQDQAPADPRAGLAPGFRTPG
jgi:hypothetical protein